MGMMKRLLEHKNELEQAAVEPALKAGAVTRCKMHGTIMTTYDDESAKLAYAIGTNMWKQGLIGGERQEFMDAIKTVIDEAAMECYDCERWKED